MTQLPDTRISLLCKISQNPHDSQGWSELVALYQTPIYRTLRCRRLQHADAMEVTQQVLVALVRYLPQFESDGKPASFRRWLNRIISNLCWKAWSSRQNPVANAIHSNSGENQGYQEVADQQQHEELRHDLEIQHYRHCFRLAAGQVKPLFTAMTWDAFWLSCVDGMPTTDIAKKLGMSPGAVYIARSRVIAKLRDQVERMEAEEGQ
jgi:RNA polymerase sigma-70 factor (ECF subfamily)